MNRDYPDCEFCHPDAEPLQMFDCHVCRGTGTRYEVECWACHGTTKLYQRPPLIIDRSSDNGHTHCSAETTPRTLQWIEHLNRLARSGRAFSATDYPGVAASPKIETAQLESSLSMARWALFEIYPDAVKRELIAFLYGWYTEELRGANKWRRGQLQIKG